MPKDRPHFLTSCCLFLRLFFYFFFPDPTPGFALDQEGAVQVISNPKSPRPPDGKRKRIVFREELTIGVAEGDENYMFGGSIFPNADDEGNFYITDWNRKRIQKYDAAGKFVLTIGRQGQGPGEFGNISIVRFDRKGRLYVTDIVNRRLNFFDKAGHFLEQISLPDAFEIFAVNSRGGYVAGHTQEVKSEFRAFKIEWGVFDGQFNLVHELFSMIQDFKPPAGRDASSVAKFLAGVLSRMVFRPQPYLAVAENELIYFGYPEEYVIDVYSPKGQKIKSIRREYDPIGITKRDKESFENREAENYLRGMAEEQKKEARGFIKYPKYKPAYSSFSLMENGWLAVVLESIENEYTLFDLFDQHGNYIGHFKAGVPSDFLFFKNGKAYAVATKDDYKFAKRYVIEIVDEANDSL
jgi:hypothetical protein